jgi:hypothetical protein
MALDQDKRLGTSTQKLMQPNTIAHSNIATCRALRHFARLMIAVTLMHFTPFSSGPVASSAKTQACDCHSVLRSGRCACCRDGQLASGSWHATIRLWDDHRAPRAPCAGPLLDQFVGHSFSSQAMISNAIGWRVKLDVYGPCCIAAECPGRRVDLDQLVAHFGYIGRIVVGPFGSAAYLF